MYTFYHYSLAAHLFRKSGHDTYLAYPRDEPDHRVVLKVFDAACIAPETTLSDFRQMEARLQGLRHPHIVTVLELGIEHGRPYLVREYQPRGSLRQYLQQRATGHLSVKEAVGVVMQIGRATAFAHAHGALHQAIRPENILLNEEGKVLLADFHVVGLIEQPERGSSAERRVESYLAPEQVTGVASAASDQYALGCLLYELLTGIVPNPPVLRQHATLNALVAPAALPQLPHQIEAVILRTLAMKPRERYPDVVTLLAALKSAVQPEPPALPFAHLAVQHQHPLSASEPDPTEAFPLLPPVTSFSARTSQDERFSQELPAFTSLEAFLTIPEWDGVSLLDRLAIADGQEDVLILSGASGIDTSSKEHPPLPEFEEPEVSKTDAGTPKVREPEGGKTDAGAPRVRKPEGGKTDPRAHLANATFSGEGLSVQPLERERSFRRGEPPIVDAEDDLIFPPMLDETNKARDTQQARHPVDDVASHMKSSRPATGTTQSGMHSAPRITEGSFTQPPLSVRTEGSFTQPPLPVWRRPVVLLVVALTLTIITASFMHAFSANVGTDGTEGTPVPTRQPDFYTQSTSGVPAYSSSMAQADGAGWSVFDASGMGCSYSGGVYQASVNSGSSLMPCRANDLAPRGDFTFQVEMVISGPSGDGGGVIFRHTAAAEYRLRVGPDGSYDMAVPTYGLISGTSTAIVTGVGQSNLLTIIAHGSSVYAYVNKQRIIYITDVSSAAGPFGLFAVDFTHPTTALFRNVKIWWN